MKKMLIFAVIAAALGVLGAKWYVNYKVEQGLDQAIVAASLFANVSYGSVTTGLDGKLSINDVVVRDMMGARDELTIGSLGLDTPSILALLKLVRVADGDMSSLKDLPQTIGIFVSDMRIPVDADYFRQLHQARAAAVTADDADSALAQCTGKYGFSPRVLRELGYAEQRISTSLTFSQKDLGYGVDGQVDIDGMWDMSFSAVMDGDMVMDAARLQSARPSIRRLETRYTDDSLRERIQRYCGSRGLTDDQVRTALFELFKYRGREAGIEFDEYVLEPYEEYLDGKSTLVLLAEPNSPVDLSQLDLYKPSDVPALLNLSAQAL